MAVFRSGVESRGARALVALAFMVVTVLLASMIAPGTAHADVRVRNQPWTDVHSDFYIDSGVGDVDVLVPSSPDASPTRNKAVFDLSGYENDGRKIWVKIGTDPTGTYCGEAATVLPADLADTENEAKKKRNRRTGTLSNPVWQVRYNNAVYDARDGTVYDLIATCTKVVIYPSQQNSNDGYYWKNKMYVTEDMDGDCPTYYNGISLFQPFGHDFVAKQRRSKDDAKKEDATYTAYQGAVRQWVSLRLVKAGANVTAANLATVSNSVFNGWGASSGDALDSDGFVNSVNINPSKSGLCVYQFDDLDQPDRRFAPDSYYDVGTEGIQMLAGYNGYAYAREDNYLDWDTSGTWIHGTRAVSGQHGGVGAEGSIWIESPGGAFDFVWGGSNCNTDLGLSYTEFDYPDFEIAKYNLGVTRNGEKHYSSTAITSPAVGIATGKDGALALDPDGYPDENIYASGTMTQVLDKDTPDGIAAFAIDVQLPFVNNKNKPKSIVISDTLDDCLDGAKAKLESAWVLCNQQADKVQLVGNELTNNWTFKEGQTFTISATSSLLGYGWKTANKYIAGRLRFVVTVPLRDKFDFTRNGSDPPYEHDANVVHFTNNASVTINCPDKSQDYHDEKRISNDVKVDVVTPKLTVKKTSSTLTSLEAIRLYVLERARFALFLDAKRTWTQKLIEFEWSKDGTKLDACCPLQLGTRYLGEVEGPPSGDFFPIRDAKSITFNLNGTVAAGETDYVTSSIDDSNTPVYEVNIDHEPYNAAYPDVLLRKVDADTHISIGQGNAGNPEPAEAPTHDMSEARFKIEYYPAYANQRPQGVSCTSTTVWAVNEAGELVFATGEPTEGTWPFKQDYEVYDEASSSYVYEQRNCLAYGTYVITETVSPTGYLDPDPADVYVVQVRQGADGAAEVVYANELWTYHIDGGWSESRWW